MNFRKCFNLHKVCHLRESMITIVLKEGVDIMNIRPYRYLHYQKNEIEKIVNEMLQASSI